MKKNVILIKFGGSLITYKDKPYTARPAVISSLVSQLKSLLREKRDTHFIIGNGAGSYAHYSAMKFNISGGIRNEEQKLGFCVVQHDAKRLNQLVVEAFLEKKIPVVSLHPSSILTSSNGKYTNFFTKSLQGVLSLNITPAIYGDIVYDETKGSHIFSTEHLFSILIDELPKDGFSISTVVYLTTVHGVLDKHKQVIPYITKDNAEEVKRSLFNLQGYDVTGGMLHKIEKCLAHAKKGVASYIVNGEMQNVLTDLLLSHKAIGTKIT